MKIILSHDVDHLYWQEHYFKDLYAPSTVFRNTKGLLKGDIELKLYFKRLKCWGRLHRLPELITFYNDYNIKANFFFGMNNALGLSYNYKQSKQWIDKLLDKKHQVGVHGIAFNDKESIIIEYNRFKELSGLKSFGIRTHYLRMAKNTHQLFETQNYIFDSSIEQIKKPFKLNAMWIIPISIMEVTLVNNAQLNQNIELWKANTIDRLKLSEKENIPYFVVNFHDLYFSNNFPVIKQWYIWLIDLLKSKNYQFINFEDAVVELNQSSF
ncbi:polysaccharide deacetylase family protein [Aureibaculum luteum]|uniref:hypothetical protein n=1 Tax=Aureibaculum luteum TaxID=1548456 RepID=UPI000E522BF9|nr:hypothetical protein [Aureibaculum luteum]